MKLVSCKKCNNMMPTIATECSICGFTNNLSIDNFNNKHMCIKCGNIVTDKSESCTNCGTPLNSNKHNKLNLHILKKQTKYIKLILVISFLFLSYQLIIYLIIKTTEQALTKINDEIMHFDKRHPPMSRLIDFDGTGNESLLKEYQDKRRGLQEKLHKLQAGSLIPISRLKYEIKSLVSYNLRFSGAGNISNISLKGDVGACRAFDVELESGVKISGAVRMKNGQIDNSHYPYIVLDLNRNENSVFNTCFAYYYGN